MAPMVKAPPQSSTIRHGQGSRAYSSIRSAGPPSVHLSGGIKSEGVQINLHRYAAADIAGGGEVHVPNTREVASVHGTAGAEAQAQLPVADDMPLLGERRSIKRPRCEGHSSSSAAAVDRKSLRQAE